VQSVEYLNRADAKKELKERTFKDQPAGGDDGQRPG